MKIRRILASLIVGATVLALAPSANASEPIPQDDPVSVAFCPPGWYGVILGVQTPSGERYVTACVQA